MSILPLVLETFSCETERLLLRPLTEGEEALFHAIYTDAETMRYIGVPMSADQAAGTFRKILAGMRQHPFRCAYLAILDKVSREPLGICGMPQFDAAAISQEVGLVLTGEARSRGIAREGLSALVNRIFVASSVSEVCAQFSVANRAARQLVDAVGFNPCDAMVSGQESPSRQRWSINRSSWRGFQSSQQQG